MGETRVLVLADGEHYPPVVRAAIDNLARWVPGARAVGVAMLGGGEKLADPGGLAGGLGVEVLSAPGPVEALRLGIARFSPDLVVDLSDEPVLDPRTRLRLAASALAAGVPYQGADFRLDPPPRPRVATKPSLAVIGTGKRTGKTAVSAAMARLLAATGRPPLIVAMGRGGPPEPELVDPAAFDLSPAGLLALSSSGRHAASDHLEDALVAGVATVGTRRCGGGLAGAPADATFAAGVALGNARPEDMLIFEGSGSAVPPAHADATVCVVPAGAEPELVAGYLGAYRLLLSDLIVVTMTEPSFSESSPSSIGAVPPPNSPDLLQKSIRGVAPEVRICTVTFRPTPLEPVSGRRAFYVTTAPVSARKLLVEHLEREHGCTIVGTSHNLARRPELAADLEGAEDAQLMLVELKAAAVDMVAGFAMERGIGVVFCGNSVVSTGGDGPFDELVLAVAGQARDRFVAP